MRSAAKIMSWAKAKAVLMVELMVEYTPNPQSRVTLAEDREGASAAVPGSGEL